MCDVYVTPYLVETQMTSGTLAYSHGLGPGGLDALLACARIADRWLGALVPFGDTAGLGSVVADL
jgi:hypothetical protein